MADNITLNAGSGGDVTGADDISGVKFPRVKLIHGADGTNAGDVSVTNPFPVKVIPTLGNGATVYSSLDLDESEEEVSATACSLYGIWFTNTATATRFLKLYNLTAANTTVGSSTPTITIGLPGNTTDDVAGSLTAGGIPILFSTALSAAVTTAAALADTGAPGTGDVIINFFLAS